MTKIHRRTVVFDDVSESHSDEEQQQYEYTRHTESDEGECDDSDDNIDNIGFDDGYDEDLMGDDNDRSMLNAMTEVEREKELFKRMERREALKARLVIERRLKAAHNKEQDLSNDKIRPKRSHTNRNKRSIDLLRMKRIKRKIGSVSPYIDKDNIEITSSKLSKDDNYLSPTHAKNNRKDRYLQGKFSDDSIDEEIPQKKSLTPITNLDDFSKLRISRHKLTFWIHQPFFEKRIPGFLVKFAATFSKQSNDTNHESNGYKVLTIRGDEERMVRIDYISNQLFTENEYNSYMEAVEKAEKSKPTLETIDKKQADMKYCINFRPNEKDIDYIVEQKNKFRKVPVNITAEKQRILIKIENARQQNDMELVSKLEDDVIRLDRQLEEVREKRSKDLDKIRIINERNRKSNIAQLEKVLEDNSSTAWGNNNDTTEFINNPFVRRRTNPVMLSDRKVHESFASKIKKQKDSLNIAVANNSQSSSPDLSHKSQQNDAPSADSNIIVSTAHNPYDISKDLENLYDFDLDISLDIQPPQEAAHNSKTSATKPRNT